MAVNDLSYSVQTVVHCWQRRFLLEFILKFSSLNLDSYFIYLFIGAINVTHHFNIAGFTGRTDNVFPKSLKFIFAIQANVFFQVHFYFFYIEFRHISDHAHIFHLNFMCISVSVHFSYHGNDFKISSMFFPSFSA